MTRVLFTVPPLAGHLYPALAVAQRLNDAGHDVAWAVDAGRIGAELPAGARVYALDDHALTDAPAPPSRGLESLRQLVEDYTLPMAVRVLPALEAAARDFRPDVLAVDHQMPAGAWAARRLGLPWTTLVTTPASLLKLSPPVLAWADERYAAAQRSRLAPGLVRPWPDLSPQQVIVFSIDELAGPPAERVPAPCTFVGPPGAGGRAVVDFPWHWLRDDTRRILVTLGTVSRDRDPAYFIAMMRALAGMADVQAVFVAPAALADQAPPNVLVRPRVPQPALLARLHGVVCHAGHNTVCEALLHDLPLVVSPVRDDQPMVARQLVDAGAAVFLRHGKATPESARHAIERLLGTPALATQARRLGTLLRAAPGADAAAALLAGRGG